MQVLPAGCLPAPTAAPKTALHRQLSTAEKAVQRRPWGMDPPQRRPPERESDFPAAVLALQQQEWSGGGEGVAKAPAPTDPAMCSPLSLAGKACLERNQRQQQQQEQPPFVVVGLIGEFLDRVLLLPTTRERRRSMGAASAPAGELMTTASAPGKTTYEPRSVVAAKRFWRSNRERRRWFHLVSDVAVF